MVVEYIVTMTKYGHGSALNIRRAWLCNRYPAMYVISSVFRGEKLADFSAFLQIVELRKFSSDFLGTEHNWFP